MTAPARPTAARPPARGRGTSSRSAPRHACIGDSREPSDGEEREILLSLAEPSAATSSTGSICSAASRRAAAPGPAVAAARLDGRAASARSSCSRSRRVRKARSPYDDEQYATAAMRADEKVHYEVVRGLAARGGVALSGSFRAAVFGANDGLVSNLALVLGIGATGVSPAVRAVQRHRGTARRRAVDGRGGVRLGPLAARAARGHRGERRRRGLALAISTSTRTSSRSSTGRAGWPEQEALARARRIVAAAQEAPAAPSRTVARWRPDEHDIVGSDWTCGDLELPALRVRRDHPGAARGSSASRVAAVVTSRWSSSASPCSPPVPWSAALRRTAAASRPPSAARSASAPPRSRTCSACSSASVRSRLTLCASSDRRSPERREAPDRIASGSKKAPFGAFALCAEGDLNPHALTGTTTSR